MQDIKTIFMWALVATASLVPLVADARLGETYQECVRRYGQPVNEEFNFDRGLGVPVKFKVKAGINTWNEVHVTAWFAKADKRERCWRIDFSTMGTFQAVHVESLLNANKGGKNWSQFGEPQRGDRAGKLFEEISYATRSDGVVVERNILKNLLEQFPESDRLRIYSREYQQAKEAQQQQDEQSSRDQLKEF